MIYDPMSSLSLVALASKIAKDKHVFAVWQNSISILAIEAKQK